ncbi:putative copper transporter 6-like [Capsicum annuum]|nr:putative copper transporter 6-like [Capsicum annuum]
MAILMIVILKSRLTMKDLLLLEIIMKITNSVQPGFQAVPENDQIHSLVVILISVRGLTLLQVHTSDTSLTVARRSVDITLAFLLIASRNRGTHKRELGSLFTVRLTYIIVNKRVLNSVARVACKAFPNAEAASHNPIGQSHFECTIKSYCISNGYLRLPRQFAVANGLINKKCDLIIRDERQRTWNLRLATHNTIVHILGGWKEFCIANGIKEGHYMMFEVVANGEKPVWKFHDKPNPSIESSRKAFPHVEEAAAHKPSGHSRFVCTIKPYCLTYGYLCLPKEIALRNGLISKKCDLIIRDECQRSWNLILRPFGTSVCIRGGWDEFRDAYCLKEGDHIMFEVVTDGETPIWKFHGNFCLTG